LTTPYFLLIFIELADFSQEAPVSIYLFRGLSCLDQLPLFGLSARGVISFDPSGLVINLTLADFVSFIGLFIVLDFIVH